MQKLWTGDDFPNLMLNLTDGGTLELRDRADVATVSKSDLRSVVRVVNDPHLVICPLLP